MNTATEADALPLSYNQEQIWFYEQLWPGSAVYNIPGAVRLVGPVNAAALQQSIATLITRHEMLRTVFLERDGRPLQRVLDSVQVELTDHAIPQQGSAAEKERTALELAQNEAGRPFDLSRGPLIRARLFTLGERDTLLQLTVHHLIADGWSMWLLVRELMELYGAAQRAGRLELPQPGRAYTDVVRRQRSAGAERTRSAALAHWTRELAGTPVDIALPFDRSRPSIQSSHGAALHRTVPSELHARLGALGRESSMSVFQTAFAIFQAFIMRISGQEDCVVGCLDAHRTHSTRNVVGCFVQTVPVRLRWSGEPSLSEVLRDARHVLGRALEHADVPLSAIVDALRLPRSSARHPLIQVLVAHELSAKGVVPETGLEWRYVLVDAVKSKFDLTLFVTEGDDACRLTVEYCSALFDPSTIERMLDGFERFLWACVEQPDACVLDLPVTTPEERQRLLYEWNRTDVPYPIDVSLPDLLERQARATPEAVALELPDESGGWQRFTYRELDGRAELVAARLRELGVGQETFVGVYLERSLELVVALLGVLKAGAAYVPLAFDQPAERLAYILRDAGLRVIIATHDRVEQLTHDGYLAIAVDVAVDPPLPAAAPSRQLTPGSAAYMIYTSGSTGRPKGVVNTHGGICNRLFWMQSAFGLTTSDNVLQKTPIGFDVSVWELFWPLITGARLVLAKPGGHRDPDYLARLIAERDITTVHFVPSMLESFLRSDVRACGRALRRVICSGEALSSGLARAFFASLEVPLFNLYGPTEAAIDVTWEHCERTAVERTVPIGRPIANTQIYILDPRMQPVPVGCPGELYIGGRNVARGYWQRPELTASRFVDDRFGTRPGARLYRTGDLARYLPDGRIEFLGRMDRQVKLNGHRIELGEIEAQMQEQSSIERAVVVLHDSAPDRKLLVAYTAGPRAPNAGEWRAFLGSRLPAHMIPARFIHLPGIPLTANGKVDWASLPSPEPTRPSLTTALVKPKTELHEALARLWCRVLGLEEVGIEDSFFELGGDSMRAIQAVALARHEGLSFELTDVFQRQTITELARVTQRDRVRDRMRETPFALVAEADRELLPAGLQDAYPMSMLQTGLLWHATDSPVYAAYVTSLRVRGHFDPTLLERALRLVAARHAMLRTSFDLASFSEPYQLVHEAVAIELVHEDLQHLEPSQIDAHIETFIERAKAQRFDWSRAPLFRFNAHRRTESTFQLSVVEPLLDGWSVAVLLTDLLATYRALLDGVSSAPLPLAASYADFVALERAAMSSADVRAYWAKRLTARPKTFLLKDTSAPSEMVSVRRRYPVPTAVQSALERTAAELSVPLKSVLLAVHVRVIGLLTGQSELLTGMISNGRPEVSDADSVVGLFLNVLPVAVTLGSASWAELIRDLFRDETAALSQRRYPLAQMQLEHGGRLFDTIFNFVDFHPYRELREGSVQVLGMRATDQTYFALTVQFSRDWSSRALVLTLDFNAPGANETAMDRMAGYFQRALHDLATDARRPCCGADLLEDAEHELLARWNETDAPAPQGSFLSLFDQQVDRTPDRVAVIDAGGSLTYRALSERVGRAAAALPSLGVGNGDVVAVLADRSADFLATMIALWRVGAVYLPLSPSWPSARIRQILDQSAASALIAGEPHRALALRGHSQQQLVRMDDLFEIPAPMPPPPSIGAAPDAPAYAIYTSGSTGQPKGAVVTHAGMLNHLLAKLDLLDLDEGSAVAQTAQQSFDISIWQFVVCLLVGGRCVVVDNANASDPKLLAEMTRAQGVSVLELVPTMLSALLEQLDAKQLDRSLLADLHWLVVTGETFPADLLTRWFDQFPLIPVSNAYGPTECSDDVTHYVAREPLPRSATSVPIGRPIRNTQLFILGPQLEALPIGAPGEIFVAGACLGLGYLNAPELTARAFIPDPRPTSSCAPRRLYRTGDLGRFLPDGNVEFLGRIDQQVKLRGHRIELAEIAVVLRSHPLVTDAVVDLRTIDGEPQLAAYVVPAARSTLTPDALRAHLSGSLAPYMVPTAWTTIAEIPTNENGKVARQALPEPILARRSSREYVAPRSELEHQLARLWQEVMGIERVGVHDDFVELGGHSLRAIQLVAKMAKALRQDVTTAFILEHPTVARAAGALAFARAVETSPAGAGVQVPSLRRLGSSNERPLAGVRSTKRRLLPLLLTGEEEPVDAAALGYWPSALMQRAGVSDEGLQKLVAGQLIVRRIFAVKGLGRIAHLVLPCTGNDLYAEPQRVMRVIADSLETAQRIGARVVSLTGLIPSATGYGTAIVERSGAPGLPRVTTGHPTTTAAVVATLQRLLRASRRTLAEEDVAILGAGSIGLSVLRLLLRVAGHPRTLTLCDVYGARPRLVSVQRELTEDLGYRGKVVIAYSDRVAPVALYHASLIVGATNVANIVDVGALRPGTIVVDDSAPHCFPVAVAIDRLERSGDILFSEGGIVAAPDPIEELRWVDATSPLGSACAHLMTYRNSDQDIMACILSSLLSAKVDTLAPSVGISSLEACVRHHEELLARGFCGAKPSCLDYTVSDGYVDAFARRYGSAVKLAM